MTVVVGVDGSPPLRTALRQCAQLIVLAASPGKSMLPGTVSQYVLHEAECPVMLMPGNGAGTDTGARRHRLPDRRGHRGAGVREVLRQARAAQAVHVDPLGYLAGTGLTALTAKGPGWIVYLYATRIIAGMGIGGEYSAITRPSTR